MVRGWGGGGGGKRIEKSTKDRKHTKLFVRIKFREKWLEDYLKSRFFNCGFIQNPVNPNY